MTAKPALLALLLAASACVQNDWPTPKAGQGLSPELITAVQKRLQAKHLYLVGPADGQPSVDLQAALWYFQEQRLLHPTGQIDRETLQALGLGEWANAVPPALQVEEVGPPHPKAGGGVFGTPITYQ